MNGNRDQEKALRLAGRALAIASSSQAGLEALANTQVAVAAATGVAAVVPYVAIGAPLITVKESGKFLVTGMVTIDKNAGTLAAGDEVILEPFVNGVELGIFVCDTGAITVGATVKAYVAFSFIASTAVAIGSTALIEMHLTTAGGHTSSVLANNGFISVIELPKAQ